ncbi:glycosyltransferase, partial [Pseudomonadota bacterium]
SGAQVARNIGLELASGEFIKLLDSDDLLNRDVLQNQVNRYKVFVSDRREIVCGYFHVTDLKGNLLEEALPSHEVRERGYIELSDVISDNPPTSSPLYRKEQLIAVSGLNENLPVLQDYDLAFRVSFAGFRFRYFPDLTYSMRDHDHGHRVSAARKSVNIEAHLRLMNSNYEQLNKLHPNGLPYALRKAFFERIASVTYKLAKAGEKRSALRLASLLIRFPFSGSVRGYSLLLGSLFFKVQSD